MEHRISIVNFLSRRHRRRKLFNRLMMSLLSFGTLFAIAPLFAVVGYIAWKGFPGLNLAFFTDLPVPVGEVGGGMGHAILGSLILVTVAALIGIPWGVGIGIFLSVFPLGKFATTVRLCCYMLASTPSIIIGLFVYSLIVVPLHHFSGLAGSVALALIMVPTAAKTTEEIMLMLPGTIAEAGLALGLPRWKVTIFLVMRACQKGIVTAMILAVARVAGETAPLLFTAFGSSYWSFSPTEPTASLPMQIYTYAISPFEEWHQQAWTGALVLVSFVLAMSLLARIFSRFNEV